MRLDNERESRNIEHARGGLPGMGSRQGLGGFGGGGLPGFLLQFLFSRFGIVGALVGIGILFAVNSFGGGGTPAPLAAPAGNSAPATPADASERFVAKVLATTEDTWSAIFKSEGARYQEPTLVFFSGQVSSGCGQATSAVGPFYCPADQKIYLDTSFFDELASRFGAPGDFAAAYVVAHEVGHHVQKLTGISDKVHKAEQQAKSKAAANALSVRLELQADCFAGVWAAHNRDILDAGDFEEGVKAAQAIGDDTLQRAAGQSVVPDSFTHGTSRQRIRWLTRGFDEGNPAACNTFDAPEGAV